MDSNWNPYDNLADQTKESQEEINRQENELNKLFYRVLSSEDGRKFLAYFDKHTVDKPCFIPGMQDGSSYGFYREGQNSIVREMHIRMEKSQQ